MTGPSWMDVTEHSKPVHWDDPEGWDGEGGGRGFRMRDTCTPMADSWQCVAKKSSWQVEGTQETCADFEELTMNNREFLLDDLLTKCISCCWRQDIHCPQQVTAY